MGEIEQQALATGLRTVLDTQEESPVFYFSPMDETLLKQVAIRLKRALQQGYVCLVFISLKNTQGLSEALEEQGIKILQSSAKGELHMVYTELLFTKNKLVLQPEHGPYNHALKIISNLASGSGKPVFAVGELFPTIEANDGFDDMD